MDEQKAKTLEDQVRILEATLRDLRIEFDHAQDHNDVNKQTTVAMLITERTEKLEDLKKLIKWCKGKR